MFGGFTTLQLKDKGKELYFREEAELFIEKLENKDLIQTSEIKRKMLFFSDKEKSQLSLAGLCQEEKISRSASARGGFYV